MSKQGASMLASLMRGWASAGSRTAAACSASMAPAAMQLLAASAKASQVQGLLLARHFTSSRGQAMSLASAIKEELTYEKQQYQKPEQIAQGPPAPFLLSEAPGDTLLTLTRSGKDGEVIAVDLHVNAQPSAPFEEEGDEEETLNFVAFNVSVTKGDTSLVFECESDGTCVNINHVSCEPKDGIEQESVYTGPVFSELDEGLQKQFASYLEERGVTAELGEYLRFLVYDKEEREYMAWLEKVQKLVG